MRVLFLIALGAVGLLAQPISVGVKGGVPVTDFFEAARGNSSSFSASTKRYLVGPTVEVNLPFRLSVEVDALYRRIGYDYVQTGTNGTFAARERANSWQFPVLAKWRILPGPVRPFIDGGANFQHIFNSDISQSTLNSTPIASDGFNDRHDVNVGFTFGGGVEFKLGPVRVSPEFRYTRWGDEAFRSPIREVLRTNKDQGDFMLGITF